jgi:hypothetical protein
MKRAAWILVLTAGLAACASDAVPPGQDAVAVDPASIDPDRLRKTTLVSTLQRLQAWRGQQPPSTMVPRREIP